MADSYEINDYVRYAANGVCKISDIAAFDAHDGRGAVEYYVLRPVSSEKTTLYVPAENAALTAKMSRVPTKAQLDEMILSAGEHGMLWQADRKLRSEAFHDVLKGCDQQALLRLVGCMYLKKQELEATGKHFSATDSAVLKQAERLIESDFAFVLDIDEREVGGYIRRLLGLGEE